MPVDQLIARGMVPMSLLAKHGLCESCGRKGEAVDVMGYLFWYSCEKHDDMRPCVDEEDAESADRVRSSLESLSRTLD